MIPSKSFNKIFNKFQSQISHNILKKIRHNKKKPIFTEIPGGQPIELIEYYKEFIDYYPKCELATKQWFVQNVEKNWVILDCGANIGYFSILFSRLAYTGHMLISR